MSYLAPASVLLMISEESEHCPDQNCQHFYHWEACWKLTSAGDADYVQATLIGMVQNGIGTKYCHRYHLL